MGEIESLQGSRLARGRRPSADRKECRISIHLRSRRRWDRATWWIRRWNSPRSPVKIRSPGCRIRPSWARYRRPQLYSDSCRSTACQYQDRVGEAGGGGCAGGRSEDRQFGRRIFRYARRDRLYSQIRWDFWAAIAAAVARYRQCRSRNRTAPWSAISGSASREAWMRSRVRKTWDAGCERALRRLGARKVSTQKAPDYLRTARVARTLLDNIFDAVSGDSVYRGETFLAGKLGQKVASEKSDSCRRCNHPRLFGSSPFDDEGVPSRRTAVIENGVLQSWLLNSYTARKLGMRTTGNASRGITGQCRRRSWKFLYPKWRLIRQNYQIGEERFVRH